MKNLALLRIKFFLPGSTDEPLKADEDRTTSAIGILDSCRIESGIEMKIHLGLSLNPDKTVPSVHRPKLLTDRI